MGGLFGREQEGFQGLFVVRQYPIMPLRVLDSLRRSAEIGLLLDQPVNRIVRCRKFLYIVLL